MKPAKVVILIEAKETSKKLKKKDLADAFRG